MNNWRDIASRVLTPKQYAKTFAQAKERFDIEYAQDNPAPVLLEKHQSDFERQRVDLLVNVVFAVILLAGAVISAPHTQKIARGVAQLTGWQAQIYGWVVFVGLELGIPALVFVTTLRGAFVSEDKRRWSLLGALNDLCTFIGIAPKFELKHVPFSEPQAVKLRRLLVFIQLAFNIIHALAPLWAGSQFERPIVAFSSLMAAILAPALLTIGGHELAHKLGEKLKYNYQRHLDYETALKQYSIDKEQAWQSYQNEYLEQELQLNYPDTSPVWRRVAQVLNVPDGSNVPNVPAIGNMAQTSQFGFAALSSKVEPTERGNGTFTGNDLELARQVLTQYPEISIAERGWHTRIAETTGVAKGRATTRIYEAMKTLKEL